MKTLERPRASTVEHQRYTIPADEVTQHIKRIVPRQAIVHYWYEVPENLPEIETQKAIKNPRDEVRNPQLQGFLEAMEKSGGLLPEDVKIMDENSREFRENFHL